MTLRHDIKVRIGDTWTGPTWAVLLPGAVGIDLTDGWNCRAAVRRHRDAGGTIVHTWTDSDSGVLIGEAVITLDTGQEVTTSTVALHHTGDVSSGWPIFVGPWDFEISRGEEDYTIAGGTFRTVSEVTT